MKPEYTVYTGDVHFVMDSAKDISKKIRVHTDYSQYRDLINLPPSLTEFCFYCQCITITHLKITSSLVSFWGFFYPHSGVT
jgi:hypothetical protein